MFVSGSVSPSVGLVGCWDSRDRRSVIVCGALRESRLVARIVELAKAYGRYGYRRIAALLRREDWRVNHKKFERIWRRERLKVPWKQPKRGRLWWNDGSCVRKQAEHRDHVGSYDFVFDRTHDGRPLRILTMVDEYTRECLTISSGNRRPERTKCFRAKPSKALANPGARDRVRGPAKLAMRLRLRRREPATLSLGNRTKGKK
jgi:hypothetical protein